jgi:hypothetical protein
MTTNHIRRLTEIEDPLAREHALLGVQTALAGGLAHLRAIKDTEHKWLELYAILVLPVIGYLMSVGATNAIFNWPLVVLLLVYLVISASLQYVLLRERLSYYAVLRLVVRSQNLLGLFDIAYLSEHFANSAFPRGYGPNPAENGTQPQSSFTRRLAYVLVLFGGLVLTAIFRWWSISPWFIVVPALCVACDGFFLWWIYRWDKQELAKATVAEARLAGSEDAWFPSPGTPRP